MKLFYFKVGFNFSEDKKHYRFTYIASNKNTHDSAISHFHMLLQDLQEEDNFKDVEVLEEINENLFYEVAHTYSEFNGGFFRV